MKITLIGYGKMGQTVEKVANELGHEVIHKMDIDDNPMERGFSGEWLSQTDVLVDFSFPNAAPTNIRNAVKAKLPIVVGTTGWYDRLENVKGFVESQGGACLYSSNFSLGVQILFYLARQAGKLFSRFPEFHPFVVEMHHAQKLDAPSGTALTLIKVLEESYQSEIPVSSVRAGSIPGNHVVGFDSPVDTLTLEHTARNREGFARGALVAAEWIRDRKGFYNFDQVIFGDDHD